MPSEVIYSRKGSVDIRVTWGNDESGMVQVVTEASKREDSDPTERLIGEVNEWLEAAGMPVIDYAELVRRSPHKPFFDGWWAVLYDWGQINRLIKVLQRARNRSFGDPA